MRPLRALATTTAAGGCLLVAACGGNPTPAPAPKPSPSASASASATPTPPALPAAAKEKTKAGAIATARHFLSAVNFAGQSGDTEPLRASYISYCTRCAALADSIDETYRKGGSYVGGLWTPQAVKFYAIKNNVAFVDALVKYDRQEWTPARGAKVRVFPASERNLKAFNLRWTAAGWRVSALDPNK